MASASVGDREAVEFAIPQPASAPQGATERRWHTLTRPVVFDCEEAMRFGPRSYTPQQRLVIDRAVATRRPLAAPRLRRG